MTVYTGTLGGTPVAVHAPAVDEYDESALRDELGDLAERSGGRLGFDIEGTFLTDRAHFDPDFRVRTVQFGGRDTAYFLRLDDPAQLGAAVATLNDPGVTFASHTNMDVLSAATRLGVDITARNVDTRGLAIMVDPTEGAERDLKTLTTRHIGPELEAAESVLEAKFRAMWPGKGNAKRADVAAYGWANIPLDDPDYAFYGGLDAIAAYRLPPILVPLTAAPPALLEVEDFLATRANRIQLRGQRVDIDALEALYEEAQTVTGTAKAAFGEITGVNAQFPAGVVAWFAEHGVDWGSWTGACTPKGAPSLAKGSVKLLRLHPLDEAARAAVDELETFKGHLDLRNKTAAVRERLDAHGRIHPSLNPMGATSTARMSAAGPNMQNFSKRDPRMRGLFLPDPGHTLVTIDFDQVELRVVAGLAREDKMIATILAGGDLHQLTVDELASARIVIDRDTGKMTNFLIVYGGGGKALSEQAGIPLEEATRIVRTWRERYRAISAYSQYLGMERDAIRTISGRRLPVGRDKFGGYRSYANINYMVQSSARELLVDAWLRFDREFGHGNKVWWPIHDELVLQVPEGEEDQVISDAEECMRFDFMGVPISASAVKLIDEQGVSRWMTSKTAEKIALVRSSNA